MSRISRLVILYVILGVCIANAAEAIFTGKQPPEALYGVLGTIGAYVLLKEGKEDKDPPKKKKREATTPEDDDE